MSILIQKRHPHTGNLNSETSGDSRNAFLHCGDVLDAGIEGEVVRAVAASRYFSMLATASGEIWSFGGGFNGELGFRHSSWVTSAQKVEGQLAQVSLIRP